jgi:hypothetical protein
MGRKGSLCDTNITAENISYIWSNHETGKIFFCVILGNIEVQGIQEEDEISPPSSLQEIQILWW